MSWPRLALARPDWASHSELAIALPGPDLVGCDLDMVLSGSFPALTGTGPYWPGRTLAGLTLLLLISDLLLIPYPGWPSPG